MSQLNPTMDRFYLSILDYAGLEYTEAVIQPKSKQMNPITVNGKPLTLPYFDNLKDPGERTVLHLLNENYIKPETAVFDLYKRTLTLELNLKLSHLVVTLINVASDPSIQAKAKSGELVDLIGSLGDLDVSVIEGFTNLFKAAKKEKDEGFLFDFHLKKNGSIGDTPYAAIGKVNFHSYNEMQRALEDRSLEYKVYGTKLRKKDLVALTNLFAVIFPEVQSEESLVEGTDNKIFRYLNILLKTSYLVASRINDLAKLLEELKEPSLNVESLVSDLSWSGELEELYGMADAIRLIPSQTDVRGEASNKLRVNESKATVAPQTQQQAPQPQQPPTFQPPPQQAPQSVAQQQAPQSTTPPSAEDIIRGLATQQQMNPWQQQQMMSQQPMMPPQQQVHLPMWAQQELMKQQPQMQQQMQPQQWQQPHQYPQQQQWQQPQMQPQMQPQQWQQPHQYPPQMQLQMPVVAPWETQPQQSGLQVNPMFMQRY
ncbi:hypothetical protein AGENTSMITH_130 [Bacillus phage vB_BspM_AgentSmith]|nr:hypothetical protein AGENTSMITH_130 [Bacillus phage vB_BspM_AgentSmith]